MSVDVSGFT